MAGVIPTVARDPRAPVLTGGMQISLQLLLLQLALWISVAAMMINATAAHQSAVLASALISIVLLWNELRAAAEGRASLGRLLLHFGIFYWFWLGAVFLAFSDPAFPSPDIGYRYFFGAVPPEVVGIGIVCVNLFSFCAIAGWQFAPLPRRAILRVADRYDPQSGPLIDALCLLLAGLAWVPIVIAHEGNLSAVATDLLAMRSAEADGEQVGLLHHLYLIGFSGGALAIARLVIALPGNLVMRIAAVAAMVPLVFLMEGSRFNLAFLIMPAFLLLLVPTGDELVWRQRRGRAATLGVLGALLILVQGAVRTEGFGEAEPTEEAGFMQTLQRGFFGHDHFGAELIAIDLVETRGDFFYEPMLPFFFTHYVPRAVWPEKPNMISWETYNEEVTQGRAFNVTPSITGQYYMNWWYFGVAVVGLLMGWYARMAEFWITTVDVRRQMVSAMVAGLLLSFVFLSFRMLHPLYFAYPLFAFIIFALVCRKARPQRVHVMVPPGAVVVNARAASAPPAE